VPEHATGSRACGHEYPSTGTFEDLVCVRCGHRKSPHATPDRAAMQERERILAIIRSEPFLVPEPEMLHPGEKIAVADYRLRLLEKIDPMTDGYKRSRGAQPCDEPAEDRIRRLRDA
jgi:hypothetical protein